MLVCLVLLSYAGIFYAYFGYPLCLMFYNSLNDRRREPVDETGDLPKLTVIVTVRNEEKVIRQKIEDTLNLHYGFFTVRELLVTRSELVQVIVASDCSTDGTDDVVREYERLGVILLRLAERGGKETAQKAAVARAAGDVIVFTDAKVALNAGALGGFADAFRNSGVGAASSVDRVITEAGTASGEGFYVRYEMWLRSLEAKRLSLVGLSGSCFAVRNQVAQNLAVDIPSDFALLLEARKLGLRGVDWPDVIGSYGAVQTEEEEFRRKVRTVLRGITALFARAEVMNVRRYGSFAWQIVSHKLCRWLVPWLFVLSVLGTFGLASHGSFFALMSGVFLVFLGLAFLGFSKPAYREKTLCKLPLFFIVTNAAIAVAWIKYLSGMRAVAWEPSAKASAS